MVMGCQLNSFISEPRDILSAGRRPTGQAGPKINTPRDGFLLTAAVQDRRFLSFSDTTRTPVLVLPQRYPSAYGTRCGVFAIADRKPGNRQSDLLALED